jgi:hypothetical protein
MSPAASIRSTTGSLATYVSKLAPSSRPGVEVVIDDHHPKKIYTTFDAVTGVVHITAPQNVPFDTVRITLEGCSKTFLQNLSAAGTKSRSVARHRFLELVMPVRESDYPHPRVAEAGVTYTFSFNVRRNPPLSVSDPYLTPPTVQHPRAAPPTRVYTRG